MPIACRSDKDKATAQVYLQWNLKDENGMRKTHVRTNVKPINVEMSIGLEIRKKIVEQIDSFNLWMQIEDVYGYIEGKNNQMRWGVSLSSKIIEPLDQTESNIDWTELNWAAVASWGKTTYKSNIGFYFCVRSAQCTYLNRIIDVEQRAKTV